MDRHQPGSASTGRPVVNTSSERLELHRTLHDHYSAMADLARAGEWEELAVLEQNARHICVRLEHSSMPTHAEDLAEIADLVARTLALDIEIRAHAEPMLESTRKLLSGHVRDQNVRKAYGAFAP